MRDREGRTWERAAEILSQIANAKQGHSSSDSTSASSATRWAASSSASARSGPKESGSTDPAERDYARAIIDTLSTGIQTTLPAARNDRDSPERRFTRAVLARYVWLPDTPAVTSRYDRRLATTLFERGVELIVVEAALLLADTRRALREPWLAPLPQVRSLAYFQPTVAEVLDNPRPPDLEYLTCLLRRLRPLAELKLARLRHQERYGDAHQDSLTNDLRNGRKPVRRTSEDRR